jgi:CheY-like chemotaxis protein
MSNSLRILAVHDNVDAAEVLDMLLEAWHSPVQQAFRFARR